MVFKTRSVCSSCEYPNPLFHVFISTEIHLAVDITPFTTDVTYALYLTHVFVANTDLWLIIVEILRNITLVEPVIPPTKHGTSMVHYAFMWSRQCKWYHFVRIQKDGWWDISEPRVIWIAY